MSTFNNNVSEKSFHLYTKTGGRKRWVSLSLKQIREGTVNSVSGRLTKTSGPKDRVEEQVRRGASKPREAPSCGVPKAGRGGGCAESPLRGPRLRAPASPAPWLAIGRTVPDSRIWAPRRRGRRRTWAPRGGR